MTPFRTELSILPSALPIGFSNKLLTAGSCFADDLGRWLEGNKFTIEVNPFGTTYNPISIHKSLIQAAQGKDVPKQKFINSNESWYHYDFHSKWNSPDVSILQSTLQKQLFRIGEQLKKADTVIITYGTSWAYDLIALKDIVANCHKQPARNFTKFLLTPDRIVESFGELYKVISELNPNVRFILTVSPVRHLKDTMELNQVSKSTLRLACHTIATQFKMAEYFPSYEIMMDDLRDYRFYKEDMIHPNETAIDYIAQKFSDRYFTKPTRETIDNWSQIKKAIEHKPFQALSSGHQKFLSDTLNKLEALKNRINVEDEIKEIRKRLESTTMA
jgi:hypothetical protein